MDKIILEDIPSLNKIEYSHISVFQKLIFYVTTAKKPFSVNVAAIDVINLRYQNQNKN
jgi:hypothetical protein